jgi:hypothetical protein
MSLVPWVLFPVSEADQTVADLGDQTGAGVGR